MTRPSYHHGDLRRALLKAAADSITETGVTALSMRDLARRAGVSHAAPGHHFADRAGLLTALATDGFEQLAKALATSRLASNSLLELGVTYLRFALANRATFEVMFRTDLYHADDPALLAARRQAADALYAGMTDLPDAPLAGPDVATHARAAREGTADLVSDEVREVGLAAWSMVHGFATLWLSGAFPDSTQEDPVEAARVILGRVRAMGR
ncbi:TetR family transcriptional regulator [Actinoplanes sp. SE50]|uniref:TetR/AcrR family transcriptional regulator n=1 Tax=unclassified Actinoplanes TaxID=2626549 RepID=UPI00023EDD76|nr:MULTISPECIES: TetR/AcrR family transcriptional regulator [unclassified Actinoplanes]AEV88608.1 HTH-type transcriptional regulator betI [Actinoplanes sp. SE50/110]ATO87012.1 TetR family transcriptional regulator [Actinoplanes sp. SE50]SLM04430.1 TetR family transcriptional regulator [Actinoplanes sp. SE50/110]